MTFPHWSRVTLYTSPCGLAECCVFVKQSHGPVHCAPARAGDPFFRSYGARLPSSLTRFLSRALVYLYPPTCVGFGTVSGSVPRGFSCRRGVGGLREASFPLVGASGSCAADLPAARPAPKRMRPSAPPLVLPGSPSVRPLPEAQEYSPDVHRLRLSASA